MYLEDIPKESKVLIQITAKDLKTVIEKVANEAVSLDRRLSKWEKKQKEKINNSKIPTHECNK